MDPGGIGMGAGRSVPTDRPSSTVRAGMRIRRTGPGLTGVMPDPKAAAGRSGAKAVQKEAAARPTGVAVLPKAAGGRSGVKAVPKGAVARPTGVAVPKAAAGPPMGIPGRPGKNTGPIGVGGTFGRSARPRITVPTPVAGNSVPSAAAGKGVPKARLAFSARTGVTFARIVRRGGKPCSGPRAARPDSGPGGLKERPGRKAAPTGRTGLAGPRSGASVPAPVATSGRAVLNSPSGGPRGNGRGRSATAPGLAWSRAGGPRIENRRGSH